jgi:hypothetical protein
MSYGLKYRYARGNTQPEGVSFFKKINAWIVRIEGVSGRLTTVSKHATQQEAENHYKTHQMTYSYKCQGKCRMVHDYTHGMNETPIFTCCGKQMKKIISTPLGIHGANTGNRKGT